MAGKPIRGQPELRPRDGDVPAERHHARRLHLQGLASQGRSAAHWDPRSYMGGFVKVAREHEGSELVGTNRHCGRRRAQGRADSRTLRAFSRPSDRRAEGRRQVDGASSRFARRHGRGVAAQADIAGVRAGGPRRLHRRHLRSSTATRTRNSWPPPTWRSA
jgi:hypothetical protein